MSARNSQCVQLGTLWRIFAVFGVMFCVFLPNSFAENSEETSFPNPDVSPVEIDEARAVELGLEHSRELALLQSNITVARHRLASAGGLENPELRVRDLSTHYFTEGFDELQLGVRWTPPRPGWLSQSEQSSRVELEERRVRAQRFQQALSRKIRRNCATLAMLEKLLHLAQERLNLETERLRIIEGLVAHGNRSVVYFTKAKMWLAESKNDLSRIEKKRNVVLRRLQRLTGVDTPVLVQTEEPAELSIPLEELLRLALESRPETRLAVQRRQLALDQYEFERYRLIPWFSMIEANYHLEKDNPDWGELMVGFELPLFNFNTGNIRATKQAVSRKDAQIEANSERIENEVIEGYNVYMEIREDWEHFSLEAGQMIEEARNIIEQARVHKSLYPDEVLELELTVVETRKMLVEKRQQLRHALLDLAYLAGLDDPSPLTK